MFKFDSPPSIPQYQEGRAVASADFRTLLEWILRNNRRLEDYTTELFPQGYGGLYLAQPITLGTPITLTTSWQKITGFDTSIIDPAKGLAVDVAGDRIAPTERGVWYYNFDAVGEITPFTQNSAQTVEVAAYNETTGTPILVGYCPVPRYSDVFDVSRAGQRNEPGTTLNNYRSLWIRQRNASPTLTINTIQELEISAFRVGI